MTILRGKKDPRTPAQREEDRVVFLAIKHAKKTMKKYFDDCPEPVCGQLMVAMVNAFRAGAEAAKQSRSK